MSKIFFRMRGFTLIELLVVIAIIAILSGLVLTSLESSKSKSRDTKRISDMNNLKTALALYYDRCKQYPSILLASRQYLANIDPVNINVGCPSGISLKDFISQLPIEPTIRVYKYSYYPSSGPVTDYVLLVQLENYNDVLKDDIDGNNYSEFRGGNIDCGTANNGQGADERTYCIGPK